MRWQSGAVVVLFVALITATVAGLAARDGDGGVVATPDGALPPSSDPAAPASPTPVERPSPSAVAPPPAPVTSPPDGATAEVEPVLPGNDVDDPLEAIVAIEAYRDHLFENPDPDKVGLIYHPECGCTEPFQELLRDLREADRRFVLSAPSEVTGPRLLRMDTDRIGVAEYSIVVPPFQILEPDGTVYLDEPERVGPPMRVGLFRNESGRWVITSAEILER